MNATVPTTIRLPKTGERKLRARANQTGWSQAEIVRAAIMQFVEKEPEEVSAAVLAFRRQNREAKKQPTRRHNHE